MQHNINVNYNNEHVYIYIVSEKYKRTDLYTHTYTHCDYFVHFNAGNVIVCTWDRCYTCIRMYTKVCCVWFSLCILMYYKYVVNTIVHARNEPRAFENVTSIIHCCSFRTFNFMFRQFILCTRNAEENWNYSMKNTLKNITKLMFRKVFCHI